SNARAASHWPRWVEPAYSQLVARTTPVAQCTPLAEDRFLALPARSWADFEGRLWVDFTRFAKPWANARFLRRGDVSNRRIADLADHGLGRPIGSGGGPRGRREVRPWPYLPTALNPLRAVLIGPGAGEKTER